MNVRLNYQNKCCILYNIENEFKQGVLPPYITIAFAMRLEVVLMVELALILTTNLLFFGLVIVSIINVALIIAFAILLSKQ